jgi:hypothetical protein
MTKFGRDETATSAAVGSILTLLSQWENYIKKA